MNKEQNEQNDEQTEFDMFNERVETVSDGVNVKEPLNNMSEYLFTKYYLDFIMSGFTRNKYNKPLISKWAERAGSPFIGLNIVDANDKVIFSTPPLLGGVILKKDGENVNFNEIVSKYESESNWVKTAGKQYLNEKVKEVNGLFKPHPDQEKNMNKWREIFKIYFKEKNEEVNDNQSSEDYLDYD